VNVGRSSFDAAGIAQRRHSRRPVRVWAKARLLGHRSERILLRNLSKGGFMAETSAKFAPGYFVEVELPGHQPVRAKVVWFEGGCMGGQFLQMQA
jgi:hypothetical protein